MPEIHVFAAEGRTLDQKRQLMKDITDAVVRTSEWRLTWWWCRLSRRPKRPNPAEACFSASGTRSKLKFASCIAVARLPASRNMPSALGGEKKCNDLHGIVDEMNDIAGHQRAGTRSHGS